MRHRPAKEIVLTGIPHMDEILNRLEHTPKPTQKGVTVLLAPSWGKSAIFKRFGAKIIEELLKTGYHIIVRPHPQSFVSDRGHRLGKPA